MFLEKSFQNLVTRRGKLMLFRSEHSAFNKETPEVSWFDMMFLSGSAILKEFSEEGRYVYLAKTRSKWMI